jgi:predicted sulfurtransferase
LIIVLYLRRLIRTIQVGCSKNEGINGTLAGTQDDLQAFTMALLGHDGTSAPDQHRRLAISSFRTASSAFFQSIGEPELTFESHEDFKWSNDLNDGEPLFPDLNVKLVSELIGTGGKLLDIPLAETARGYLTPREWHDRLQTLHHEEDTILIDCRNTKEYEIGHFNGAVDPNTTSFSQFPKWVEDHKLELSDKNVLMYCTGGIRCEKVSR